jgi:hypothetical protein
MKLTNIQGTYVAFGNFTSLINNIDKVKANFPDYEVREQREQLPNGLQAPFYAFVKQNEAFVIRSSRIDTQYGYKSEDDVVENFIASVNKTYEKLSTLITTKFNRVSYNNVAFVEKTEESLNKACEIFNANDVFGTKACELQVRLNNILTIGSEEINAVFTIQDGHITRRNTNVPAQEDVLFLNNDVNTLAQHVTPRITCEEGLKMLSDLVMVANERTNKVLEKLN